ncbi:hypothetical protein AN958_09826 [Leucoagaricus sp. SymC.cos]|nr:hypothetical protein AN958_09826 [Leucoagaricus sp. SymC.cos]
MYLRVRTLIFFFCSSLTAYGLQKAQAKELILWSHLSHQNIVPFYGVWIPGENGQFCIVSPWMTKGNLNQYLSAFPDVSRLPLLSDVIHGLDYLHKANIVHADLKGANVLVSDNGRAMLSDFGISHIVSTRLETTTIASVGTPHWTAPELAMGDGVSPTAESDIWSFGCVIYEVLTDNAPFHWLKTSHQILAAMMRNQITPLKLPAGDGSSMISEQLRDIMERCFNYAERDRPKSGDIIRFFIDLNIEDNRDDNTASMVIPRARADVKIDYECVCKILKTVRRTTLEPDNVSEGED